MCPTTTPTPGQRTQRLRGQTVFCQYLRENRKFHETVFACSNRAQVEFFMSIISWHCSYNKSFHSGNHEASSMNMKDGFHREIMDKYNDAFLFQYFQGKHYSTIYRVSISLYHTVYCTVLVNIYNKSPSKRIFTECPKSVFSSSHKSNQPNEFWWIGLIRILFGFNFIRQLKIF